MVNIDMTATNRQNDLQTIVSLCWVTHGSASFPNEPILHRIPTLGDAARFARIHDICVDLSLGTSTQIDIAHPCATRLEVNSTRADVIYEDM